MNCPQCSSPLPADWEHRLTTCPSCSTPLPSDPTPTTGERLLARLVEEFELASTRQANIEGGQVIVTPIYWRNAPLGDDMERFNWIDCREADGEKLAVASMEIAGLFQSE